MHIVQKSYCCLMMLSNLSFNINQVLAAPPPIPVDSDSEVSDFSEFEDEHVEEIRLHPSYDPRYCEVPACADLRYRDINVPLRTLQFVQLFCLHRYPEKEVPTEFSNHVSPSAILQAVPPQLQTSSPQGSIRTPAVMLNDMKNWAKSKISSRATATPSQLQKTDLGYQKSQIAKPPLRQETDLGHQKSQILEPPPLQPTVVGYRKSQILEPPPLQPTDLGNQKSQILEPPPVQPTDLGSRKAQIPKPPRLQKTDLGCRKSQTLELPPLQETDPEYQKSQIIEPPLLQQTDIGCQKSQILEPPPIQQTDHGHLKSQIPKPPRPQKFQIPVTTNQTQHTDTLKSNNSIRPTPVQDSSPHQMHQAEINNDGALLQAPSICLTVEDPYFGPDSPMSTGSTECTEVVPLYTKNPCVTEPTLALETQSIDLPMQDVRTGENANVFPWLPRIFQ